MHTILRTTYQYLLYIFIFSIPWHTIWILREVFYGNEKWQYSTIGIYTSDIALILLIAISIYLYKDILLTQIFKRPKLLLSGLFLSIWGFISIVWANDKEFAFYFAIKLSVILDLFFLIQIIPFNIYKLIIVFFTSVFIQSIIGLYQFITQQTFAQKFLGLQYHDIFSGGNAIVQTHGERWLRAYGGTPHPNIFGLIILCALLLGIYLFIKRNSNIFFKTFILFGIVLLTANILYTFSRTIWLTSILSIFALIIYSYKNNRQIFKRLIIPVLLISLTILIIIILSYNLFFDRISKDTTFSHNSISDRSLYISQSKSLIISHPVIGVGIGNYTNTLKINSKTKKPLWQYQPVHNIYLLISSELGLIGFGLFILFIINIFYALHLDKKNTSITQFIFVTLFIGILFISLFDHLAWTSHFGLIALFLFSGLSLRKYKP